jgi:hypothetical protein
MQTCSCAYLYTVIVLCDLYSRLKYVYKIWITYIKDVFLTSIMPGHALTITITLVAHLLLFLLTFNLISFLLQDLMALKRVPPIRSNKSTRQQVNIFEASLKENKTMHLVSGKKLSQLFLVNNFICLLFF